jgi:uncharacterized membrane protein
MPRPRPGSKRIHDIDGELQRTVFYAWFKCLHLLGVILLLGNAIVTGVWKALADRSRLPSTVAYAQRLVIVTDWVFTGSGIALTVLGGYGMVYQSHLSLTGNTWLMWGQGLFALSALIWLALLLPLQTEQSRMARRFAADGRIPEDYWRLGRRWLSWGVLATLPLLVTVFLMTAKV